jgi:hypothetical protein
MLSAIERRVPTTVFRSHAAGRNKGLYLSHVSPGLWQTGAGHRATADYSKKIGKIENS